MSKTKGKPTLLQKKIIEYLVNGWKPKDIAIELDCNPVTVYKTKTIPELRQYYNEQCNDKLKDLLPIALKRLQELLEDNTQQGSVHIACIKEILDRSKISELTDTQKNYNVVVSYK